MPGIGVEALAPVQDPAVVIGQHLTSGQAQRQVMTRVAQPPPERPQGFIERGDDVFRNAEGGAKPVVEADPLDIARAIQGDDRRGSRNIASLVVEPELDRMPG